MIFRSPTENENLLRFLTQFSEHLSFPHAFSENPGGIRTGPLD